jgi:hypothetical protein
LHLLCIPFIYASYSYIGLEEGALLVEFVVEEENPQELPPEGEG